jgi:hypothetical protein
MSNVNYTFFASRTAARNAVVSGTKFKDHGPSAAKGARWSTFSLVDSKPTLKTAMKATAKASTPRTNSKKEIALQIMRKMFAKDASRQEVLTTLQTTAGLSAPGSSTYFANFKNGTWS